MSFALGYAIMSSTLNRCKMIGPFEKEFRWLSNFWPAEVVFEEMQFRTVEHAYVAAKTLDPVERQFIQSVETPGQAKLFGRHVELRPDWLQVRLSVMEDLIRQKFQNEELREKLLATGEEEIIGDRDWETILHVCQIV